MLLARRKRFWRIITFEKCISDRSSDSEADSLYNEYRQGADLHRTVHAMLKPSLQLKLGQTLTMTPQLQQAIRLLQLPVLDLNAQIQDALEENIMLEMEDLPDVPQTSAETTAEVETIKAEASWEERAAARIQDGGWNGEGRPISEFAGVSGAPSGETDEKCARAGLDAITMDLEMGDFTPRQALIGEAIVDSINDDGYLTIDVDEITASLGPGTAAAAEEIEEVVRKVQRFDPVGVAARTIPECLTLQLEQLDEKTPGLELAIELARLLLAQHQEDLVAVRHEPATCTSISEHGLQLSPAAINRSTKQRTTRPPGARRLVKGVKPCVYFLQQY